jgi:hypothetical protein
MMQGPEFAVEVVQREQTMFDLLCACLRFDAPAEDANQLTEQISRAGWESFLQYAVALRLDAVLVRTIARRGLAPPIPAMMLPDGRVTITKALAQFDAHHSERRSVLLDRLVEIVAALNGDGIVPVVLKGGRSLVVGQSDWRQLRDIDLLVEPRLAAKAQDRVRGLGYRGAERPRSRLVHHHLEELYRDNMPGWIEIHRRGGPSRVEQFLPTAELLNSAEPASVANLRLGILPPHLDVLHGVIHHHVGHRAVKRAEIDTKGLYEFGAGVMALSQHDRQALLERAARHPRVLAILELWTTAAAELFGMSVSPELAPAQDAIRWWRDIATNGSSKPGGVGHELRAALSGPRMRRAAGGGSRLRRAYWHLSVPLSFVKRPVWFG